MNVTVIGIGRLGLGLALLIEKGGYNVCGVDINKSYVDELNNKLYKTKEPFYEEYLKNSKNFNATTSLEKGINHSDILFIVVQTPNGGGNRFYDHDILSNLLMKLNSHKLENKKLIIGCTTMPNYINEVGKFLLQDCKNTTISYNPEFIAQGEIIKGFEYSDMILIGTEDESLVNILKPLYKSFMKREPTFCVVSQLEGEIIKIGLNGYITSKISFANMLSDYCDKMNVDKYKVLRGIGNDSRIGHKYFNPGYSFGGPCFPRDTKALKQCLDIQNINTDILNATTLYNELHVKHMSDMLLAEKQTEYVFTNVCYKENSSIPIIEESAKLKIAKYIHDKGFPVTIKDNIGIINEVKKEYGNIFKYELI